MRRGCPFTETTPWPHQRIRHLHQLAKHVERRLVHANRIPQRLRHLLHAVQPLDLGPGHHRFVFDYTALSLRAPLQVTYRFRLEGFDRDWIDAGNRRSAEYTNLPPGTYRLLVEARNADGTPGDAPAELRLRIAAPIYRRWWFYALLLLLAAAAVYATYRLRLRRVQQQFSAVLNERNRIAREIHDTLAQDFVAVSLQLEVTAQLLKVQATEAAQEQIDATRLLVRDGIRDARESIWALRAGQSAADLPARLRAIVDTAPATPAHSLTVTGSYRALSSSLEKEIVRIAKEAIGNAVRHAGAGYIQLTLLYSEDAVVLTVRDDGAGFNVDAGAARIGHFGLRAGLHVSVYAVERGLIVGTRVGVAVSSVQELYTGRSLVIPDGMNTIAAQNAWHDANDGKWHEEDPPQDPHFAETWALRCRELMDKYDPDLLYFDDTELPLGQKGLDVTAHFYNSSVARHGSQQCVVFAKKPTPETAGAYTLDIERSRSTEILAQPWQTDTCIGDWHYKRSIFENHTYKTPAMVIALLIDVISKNGNLLLSIPVRGTGAIDEDEHAFLQALAGWIPQHGEAIYGTRPFAVYGEGPPEPIEQNFSEKTRAHTAEDIRFTKRGEVLYSTLR